MRFHPIKKFDIFIMKKFLGTFFFSIILILGIVIIFDLSEKIDDFIEKEAPLRAIVVDYYFNFIPYFSNLFSGLFTFIAVIFFTSKLAFNSEIIAILSSGISFKRFLRPYLLSAFIIASVSWYLGAYVIPPANEKMIDFKYTYVKSNRESRQKNIHRQIAPDTYLYMESYNSRDDLGKSFTLESFENDKLVSKLSANLIKWDRSKKTWTISNYVIRKITDGHEILTKGEERDTTLNVVPEDFIVQKEDMGTMTTPELLNYIEKQKLRGVDALEEYELERHQRIANPFSVFILTLIGASLASRKIRGGIGLHIGIGLLLAFTYIMFQQVSKVFAMSGAVTPLISNWIPNLVYGIIALLLYKWSSR